MTTDLEGLWADCQLGLLADYYEDLGDSLTAEALHWLVANEYIPDKMGITKDWPYAAGFTSFERQSNWEANLITYYQSALPEDVWVNMTGYAGDVMNEYWKYWKTQQAAYQGALDGYKTARRKGLVQ